MSALFVEENKLYWDMAPGEASEALPHLPPLVPCPNIAIKNCNRKRPNHI